MRRLFALLLTLAALVLPGGEPMHADLLQCVCRCERGGSDLVEKSRKGEPSGLEILARRTGEQGAPWREASGRSEQEGVRTYSALIRASSK